MRSRLASDDRLVEQLRAGSEAAFEAIFDRHHRGILAFCRHLLGSVEEAEDAVQQTFLAAYRDLVGSDKPVQLRPWLYTIARNRCVSVLRSAQRPADAEAEPPPTEHLSAVVERRQDLRDLLGDLSRLPEDQRSALVLAEVGGMSHEEIAAVLSCRREKVKALVFQARTALIAGRTARETPCAEIREQLANLSGSALRRGALRRHLHDCAGCREYRDQVRAQRRELGLVLPVAPTIGLKAGVLASAGVAAAGAGGGAGAAATGSLAAKALMTVALAGGGVAAVETVHERGQTEPGGRARAAAVATPESRPVAIAAAPAAASPRRSAATKAKKRHAAKVHKRRGPKAKAAKVHRAKVKVKVKVKGAKRHGPKPKKVHTHRPVHSKPAKPAKGHSKHSK